MLRLTYDALGGMPFRDGEVEHYLAAVITGLTELPDVDLNLHTATENLINAVRVAVLDGRLSVVQVELLYLDHMEHRLTPIQLTYRGRILDWPNGFCDTNANYTRRLVDWDA